MTRPRVGMPVGPRVIDIDTTLRMPLASGQSDVREEYHVMSNPGAAINMDPDLRERIHSARALPSPPIVAARLIEIAEDPDVNVGAVVDVLRTDPAMSARLLRLANSPLYARNRRTTNVSQAVMMLGIDAVLTAALSMSLLSPRAANQTGGLSFEHRWTRSVHAAVAAQVFAERCRRVRPGEAFLAALLQEIGVLVIDRLEPATYESLTPTCPHDEIIAAELATLGVDHAAVGAELLAAWRIPDHIVAAVRSSHETPGGGPDGGDLKALVVLGGLVADSVADEFESLVRAEAVAKSALGIEAPGFAESVEGFADAIPELAPLLDADVPEPEVLAEMASDVIIARQLQGQADVAKLRGELETMSNRAAELDVERRIDPVTGVFNRQHLDELLATEHQFARDHGYPMSILFVDLDHFKSTNDRWGHQFGDEILARAAALLGSSIRDDDAVGRYGGDEFVVVLASTELRSAEVVAQRLVEAFRRMPLEVNDGSLHQQTVSIGVASSEHGDRQSDIRTLLHAADTALFAAKRAGRNGWRSAHGEDPVDPVGPPVVVPVDTVMIERVGARYRHVPA